MLSRASDDLLLNLFIVLRIHDAVRIPSLQVDEDVGMARFQRKALVRDQSITIWWFHSRA